MRKFLTTVFLLLPAVVFALDYTDVSTQYADAPFIRPEAAGISVLTSIGAVEGNPDGKFHPERTLNRAEFSKIVWLSVPNIMGTEADDVSRDCFPDVRSGDWFSDYVCPLKKLGAIKGYPDGKFHPERPVNYAEALKILGESYDVIAEVPPNNAWYVPYREGAYRAGVGLPAMEQGMEGRQLTRGEVARLAAAYLANAHGELEQYRSAERGQVVRSSSSSSSLTSSTSSISSSSSSSISSTSSTSSTPSASTHDFPARSRLLVAGERSQPIGSATFFARLEAMFVRSVKVLLYTDVDAIESMWLIDSDGHELGQVYLDKVFDPNELTWRASFSGSGVYRIPKDEQRTLGIEVRMKERNKGGTSEEMVQVRNIEITTEGEWSGNSATSGQVPLPFPKHQTAMGRITAVQNAGETSGILPVGVQQLLGIFRVIGSAVSGVTLRIEHLEFQVSKSPSVAVTNWQIGVPGSPDRWNCSTNENTVNCTSIPESLGTLSGGLQNFTLYGDVSLLPGGNDKDLQISLNRAGDLETNGAVRWTDTTGHFNWVELESPLVRGTLWK